MGFWGSLLGYQAVWFAIVIGAGRGQPWPGIVAAVVFVAWQAWGPQRIVMLRLVVVGLVAGSVIDGVLARGGLLAYASPWPSAAWPPAWIFAVWAAFAVTLPRSLAFLQGRPWLAGAFGAVGGPLAYLAAARLASAVVMPAPQWPTLGVLALAWAIAMPAMVALGLRFARADTPPRALPGVLLR